MVPSWPLTWEGTKLYKDTNRIIFIFPSSYLVVTHTLTFALCHNPLSLPPSLPLSLSLSLILSFFLFLSLSLFLFLTQSTSPSPSSFSHLVIPCLHLPISAIYIGIVEERIPTPSPAHKRPQENCTNVVAVTVTATDEM